MFKKIAPKRFLFSVFLIASFIVITLSNLKEADQLFTDIQTQISDSLGWLIILAYKWLFSFCYLFGF